MFTSSLLQPKHLIVKLYTPDISISERCIKIFPPLYCSDFAVASPPPHHTLTNHPQKTCHLPQMMETSVLDTAATPYGNLTVSCFPNQLAKNIIPYADLCTTHPHFFHTAKEQQPFPAETDL